MINPGSEFRRESPNVFLPRFVRTAPRNEFDETPIFLRERKPVMRPLLWRRLVVPAIFLAQASVAAAETHRGAYVYSDEKSCVAGGRVDAPICANAAANARAEFDEKAPRYPTREACDRVFPRDRCSVGFSGADGWAGKRSAIYFSPRMFGFRINILSEREAYVTPMITGISFSRRTAMRRDTGVDFAVARQARRNWRPDAQPASGGGESFGVDTPPSGDGSGAVPRPPIDPNFNCAAVLEPNAHGDAASGCYPMPGRHR